MRSKFLIIGFTGPLGSGCSTAADFLKSDLTNYQINSKNELNKTERLMGEYYKYLKTMQKNMLSLEGKYKSSKNSLHIIPEEYLENIEEYSEKSKTFSEENRKEVNRKLRKIIEKRDLLNLFIGVNIPKFKVISMSDMIVKLVIQKAVDEKGEITKEFKNFKCEDEDIKEEILSKAKEYRELLNEYDEMLETSYRKEEIDKAFIDIKKLNKSIAEKKSNYLQDFGDNLRGTGNPFISREKFESCPKWENHKCDVGFENLEIISNEANKYVKYMRRRTDGNKSNYFVIDSFRNPYEIDFFRKRYGSFYLCSVFANKSKRKKRLNESKGLFSEQREERDQGKRNSFEDLHKQSIPACTLISDYAINNENDIDEFRYKLIRFLMLIDNPGCQMPTSDETFMNIAYTLSLRSTCLSRQVGAVITNSNGYIIGAGWNDVGTGQLGCHTRCKNDYSIFMGDEYILNLWEKQFRDFEKKELLMNYEDKDYICFKDIKSKEIISDKIDRIFDNYIKEKNKINEELKREIYEFSQIAKQELNIKRLEYARSLHAEENAILQVAINGGIGIANGTIYTTTFPCELCAKKIYQSGIKRIVYIEPYPESISESIFLKDGVRHIEIDQFEGVTANSYYKLFKSPLDRKDMQKLDKIKLYENYKD